jgi:hypothetical protein
MHLGYDRAVLRFFLRGSEVEKVWYYHFGLCGIWRYQCGVSVICTNSCTCEKRIKTCPK